MSWLSRHLRANSFSGSLPTEIGLLFNLDILDLSGNSLSGSLPTEMGTLFGLEELRIQGNRFTGGIPTEIGGLSELEILDLSSNGLRGTIPTELAKLTQLNSLYLNDNELSGTIPTELGARKISRMLLRGTNHFCPLLYYSHWAAETDSPWDSTCTACPFHFPLCPSGEICTGGFFEIFKCEAEQPTDPEDQSALVALWSGFSSKGHLSWYTPSNLCGQEGIICTSGKVTGLDIWYGALQGTIATQLGALTGLTRLSMGGKGLSGTIPTEIGALKNLERLSVHFSSLSGTLPTEIGTLGGLTYLHLSENSLSGTIPTEIGALTQLTELTISEYSLSGSIPTEIFGLSRLARLDLWGFFLSGSIPTEIGTLLNLTQLRLAGDLLSGTIPTEIGALTNLQELWLYYSSLSGTIPTELGLLTNLRIFNLNDNRLSGTIPTELVLLTALRELNLQNNLLGGTIPTELANLDLDFLYLRGTNHFCPLPDYSKWGAHTDSPWDRTCTACGASSPLCLQEEICLGGVNEAFRCVDAKDQKALLALWNGFTSKGSLSWNTNEYLCGQQGVYCASDRVMSLSIPSRNIHGTIATQIGDLTHLSYLYLYNNHLGGTIPTEIGALTSLNQLFLSENSLSGTIPTEIGAMTSLGELLLSGNSLSGTIPTELGLLNFIDLALSYNQLSGTIPTELTSKMFNALYLGGTNHFCPLTNYSELATYSDAPSDLSCTACGASFPLCLSGQVCYGGENEEFSCEAYLIGAVADLKVSFRFSNLQYDWYLSSPENAQSLEAALIEDLAAALGVAKESIAIINITPGSVVVQFKVSTALPTIHKIATESLLQGPPSTLLSALPQDAYVNPALPASEGLTGSLVVIAPCRRENYFQYASWNLTSPGTVATGKCARGYQGAPTRRCREDGTWEAAIQNPCAYSICPEVEEAGFTWPSRMAYQSAYFSCPQGYKGLPYRTCRDPGVWSEIRNPCTLITCGAVASHKEASWPQTLPGQVANGTCLPGYAGNITWACGSDARWGVVEGRCDRIRCPTMRVDNTTWYAIPTGQNATGKCDKGFSGSPTRLCQADGTWAEVLNPCTRRQCNASSSDEGAFEATDSLTTATGTCSAPFEGAPTRLCRADGTWDPIKVPCSLRCAAISYRGTFWPETLGLHFANGTCENGYQSTGVPVRWCRQDGTWHSGVTNPCRNKRCPAMEDGKVLWPETNSFQIVRVACPGGKGTAKRQCLPDTTWGPLINQCP